MSNDRDSFLLDTRRFVVFPLSPVSAIPRGIRFNHSTHVVLSSEVASSKLRPSKQIHCLC